MGRPSLSGLFAQTGPDASRRQRVAQFLLFLVALLAVDVLLYRQCIFGDRVMVFSGMASDNIGQNVPFLLNQAGRLQDGDISLWNQYQFLGATTVQLLSLDFAPAWFGVRLMPWALLVSQMAKVALAGVFFYLLTGYFGVDYKTRFAAGLGYGFCGRVIALAPWTNYSLDVTIAAAMLWAFERFYRDQRHFVQLPLAYASLGISLGTYWLVIYTALLVAYAIFRVAYSWDETWRPARLGGFVLATTGLLVLGLVLASPGLVPTLQTYTESARVSSDVSSGSIDLASWFALPTFPHPFCAQFLLAMATAVYGTLTSYSGLGFTNFTAAPYYFVGTLAMLSVPLAFSRKSARQRVCLGLILLFVLFFNYSPAFRVFLSGFTVGRYDYRQSALVVNMILAVVGTYGIDRLWKGFDSRALAGWAGLLVALLALCAWVTRENAHVLYVIFSAGLVIAYTVGFCLRQRWGKDTTGPQARAALTALLVLAIPVEMLLQNNGLCTKAGLISKDEYQAIFVDSDPTPAICARDADAPDLHTYRVDYQSQALAQSMTYNYLSTSSYIGGAGFSGPVVSLLRAVGNDYVQRAGYSRYVYCFHDLGVNALLGARYTVQSGERRGLYYRPYGYTDLGEDSFYRVQRNELALPLIYGYGTGEVSTAEALEQSDRVSRGLQLLTNVVLPEGLVDAVAPAAELPATTPVATSPDQVIPDHPVTLDFEAVDAEYLMVQADLSAEITDSSNAMIIFELSNPSTGAYVRIPYYTAGGGEAIRIPVENIGYTRLRASYQWADVWVKPVLSDLSVGPCPAGWTQAYEEAVAARRTHPSEVTRYQSGVLEGTITMAEDGWLASSIPWDSHWRVFIDGVEAEPVLVNLAFVGARIDAGEHAVRFVHDETLFHVSLVVFAVTLPALLVVACVLAVRRRRRDAEGPGVSCATAVASAHLRVDPAAGDGTTHGDDCPQGEDAP